MGGMGGRRTLSTAGDGGGVPWLLRHHPGVGGGGGVGTGNVPHPIPRVANFVNGSFRHPRPAPAATIHRDDGIPVVDPSTNVALSHVTDDSSSEAIDDAVRAASDAYPGWSITPVQARQRLLAEYANLLHRGEVREEIAQLS